MSGSGEVLFDGPVWVTVMQGIDGGGGGGPALASHGHGHSTPTERELQLCVELVKELNGGGKDIAVRLTDEADPFFLYTLRLSMEEFTRLRQAQNLKVDFATFPRNLVGLIGRCGPRGDEGAYVLELDSTAMPSSASSTAPTAAEASNNATLSVVETNAFKNLVHLSLRLTPGTDATVKKHLAGCLVACKAECVRLRDALSATESKLSSELESARDEAAAATASASALRTELTNVTTRLASEHAMELARLRDDASAARAAADEQSRRASRMAEEAATSAAAELRVKLAEATASDAAKSARLVEVEGVLRDVQARLALAESAKTAALADLEEARSEIRALRAKNHEADCALTENRVRIAELTQQVKGKTELERQQALLTAAAHEHKAQAEESARQSEQLRVAAEARAERCAAEITKGNGIIARLQRDLAALHTKLDARSSVVVRQEQAIGDLEKTRARLESNLAAVTAELEAARRSTQERDRESERAGAELAETRRLLKNSEGIITWLNKQLNDVKRGKTIDGAREVVATMTHHTSSAPSRGPPAQSTATVKSAVVPTSKPGPSTKSLAAAAVRGPSHAQTRAPLGSKSVNIEANRKVQYARNGGGDGTEPSTTMASKYFGITTTDEDGESGVGGTSGKSRLPRVAATKTPPPVVVMPSEETSVSAQ